MTGAPIGIFDSGIGGMSVYAEMRRVLPDERVLYVADQGFGMYGERSLEAVRERSETIARRLIQYGAGVVVVACNSASAAALTHLRATWPEVSFVGMEPAVKPATLVSKNGTIGVLATEATFQGELFASVVDRFASDHDVVDIACPGLAAAIEEDSPIVDRLVSQYVGEVVYRGADVVVLGCTHYSLIRGRIGVQARPAVVIDPAPAVARQVARVVDAAPNVGGAAFLTTSDADRFAAQLDRLGFDPGAVGTLTV